MLARDFANSATQNKPVLCPHVSAAHVLFQCTLADLHRRSCRLQRGG